MPWYLEHHFDPDFDHLSLKPKEMGSGKVNHYNLGYVQNVIVGQLVANLREVSPEETANLDPRFIFTTPNLPCGPNCIIDPEDDHALLAAANGYIFYHKGLITVKKTLNVRRAVDFHTGNIVFVNDIAVHGSVRTGFGVYGKNVLVKGVIEGAKIHAQGTLASETGVKGQKTAQLYAYEHIRLPFCENAELHSRGNILIDGACMHTDIYSTGNIVIKGRLQGGTIYTSGTVCVMEQLGGGQNTTTQFVMGYDPFLFSKLRNIEEGIKVTEDEVSALETLCAKSTEFAQEFTPQKKQAAQRLQALHRIYTDTWKQFEAFEIPPGCRLFVAGTVCPGVEIAIGKAYLKVQDYLKNVCFCLENQDIAVHPSNMQK